MPHPQIPDDVLRVSEPELAEKLSTLLDRVAYQEEELVVMRVESLHRLLTWVREGEG